MLLSQKAKLISDRLRRESRRIKPVFYQAFESAIVGCGDERIFFRSLIKELSSTLSSLSVPGAVFKCRVAEIHAKPIVSPHPPGSHLPCELGDLLVVVKYHLPTGDKEVKSIIYQAKLSNSGSGLCSISQRQLNLLADWPPFSFGKDHNGTKQVFHIQPTTLEFGSYLLEPRQPKQGDYLTSKYKCYGVCPYAEMVRQNGPTSVALNSFSYARGDANNFFSHLVFEIGEPHTTPNVDNLVNALYRYIGLAPDPPDEFEGYYNSTEDDGFAVLEINVSTEEP